MVGSQNHKYGVFLEWCTTGFFYNISIRKDRKIFFANQGMSGINDTTRYSVFIGQIVANGFHYKVDMNLEAGWQICVK